mgnify:CR=1 FL=1
MTMIKANGSRQFRGFTLIEMMITISIVGLLFAVAVPSYNQSKRKTRRSDAVAAVLAIQVAQENFRGSCPYYAQGIGNSNTCGASASASIVKGGTTSDQGHYTMSIAPNSATGNAYQIVATATGDQASDTGCTTLTITFSATNPKGLKAPTDCWAR